MTAYSFPSESAVQARPRPARAPQTPPGPPGPAGDGLRVRFAAIPGETRRGVLTRPIWLQAAIAPMTRQGAATFSDYTTVSAGDFSFAQGGDENARQLETWPNLNTLILSWDAPWLVQHGQDPDQLAAELWAILHSRRAVEMVVTIASRGSAWPWGRWDVTFRQLTEELREDGPDAMYYAVQLSQWRHSRQQRRGANPRTPATRLVQVGDTLHSLSAFYYGSAVYWRAIRDANGISRRFGASAKIVGGTRFKAGAKLVIPAKPSHIPLSAGVRR